jgi:hypothetical protein
MARKKLRSYRGKINTSNMVKAGHPRHRGIVYGYQFPSRTDIMKIGYSSRGLIRVYEQSTGFPETPDVLFSIHAKNAKDIEGRIHKDLAHRQVKDVIGTEWFAVDLGDVLNVSPELRKAMGRQRWKSFWVWFSFLLFVSVWAIALPLLSQVLTFLGGGEVTALSSFWQAYWGGLFAEPWLFARFVGSYAWDVVSLKVPSFETVVAGLMFFLPGWWLFLKC